MYWDSSRVNYYHYNCLNVYCADGDFQPPLVPDPKQHTHQVITSLRLTSSNDLVKDVVQLQACSPHPSPEPSDDVNEAQRWKDISSGEAPTQVYAHSNRRHELVPELTAANLAENRLCRDRIGAGYEQPPEIHRLTTSASSLDTSDEGQRLVIPDGCELPHHLCTEELHRAKLAQHPPISAIWREGDIAVLVAEELRNRDDRPRREGDILLAENLLRRRRRGYHDGVDLAHLEEHYGAVLVGQVPENDRRMRLEEVVEASDQGEVPRAWRPPLLGGRRSLFAAQQGHKNWQGDEEDEEERWCT